MIFHCGSDRRRARLTGHAALNGLDYIEVVDDDALPDDERQRRIILRFVNPIAFTPAREQVRIRGGERIRSIEVVATAADAADAHRVVVEVDRPGDFSDYTLALVTDVDDDSPPAGIDPALASAVFSFKAACKRDFDCDVEVVCPEPPRDEPPIDYLAKDYEGFRRILLDRMATLQPGWRDRNPADVRVALVELLAHAADVLSYRQDAVATEAYMGTARRRVSARRHARLVDYAMHDGCNARAWLQVRVEADVDGVEPAVARGTQFLTGSAADAEAPVVRPEALVEARRTGAEVFEAVFDVQSLFVAHNDLRFHTWDGEHCCLPAGATSATLAGHHPTLVAGSVLMLAELRSPTTGRAEEADATHRQAVRLTGVEAFDAGGQAAADPLDGTPITTITWHHEDALAFPLCVTAAGAGGDDIVVGVALGNLLLVDHGETGPAQALPPVTPRYRPLLAAGPVTQIAPAAETSSAASCLRWAQRDVLPAVAVSEVLSDGSRRPWTRARSLIGAGTSPAFVVEVENDALATLRFGDGVHGAEPDAGARLLVDCRIGNGPVGNVGVGAICRIVERPPVPPATAFVEHIWNPAPAVGGRDPETVEEVRLRAPAAFRVQERAVTPEDYARRAERYTTARGREVQRAVGTLRWTGSWHTMFVTVDRDGGRDVDADFEAGLLEYLDGYRMAGQDIEVDGPRYVPLDIEMTLCVDDGLRSEVYRRVRERVRELFSPDALTFNQPVYLGPIYAAAQGVPGVRWVDVTRFARQGDPSKDALEAGRIDIGRVEIARFDDDPNYPDRGALALTMTGGS